MKHLAPALLVVAVVLLPAAGPASPALDTAGMVLVPDGEFWMGRTRLWLIDEIGWQVRDRADDRPVHRVVLPAFHIDAYEVTNASYAAHVASGRAEAPVHWNGPTPPAGRDRLPVYNITWAEADAYCRARGKRLPTEAEWERAARGGLEDQDYPWGNEYVTVAAADADATATSGSREIRHAHANSALGPTPVGSFEPNPFGLYDMSGNVWEWVADWYDLYYYGVSPVDGPAGPAQGLYKVIRGGSWADAETRHGTVYFRNYTAPDLRTPTVGFRCAADAPRSGRAP